MRNRPVIFVDDDTDDLEMMKEMASEMYYPTPVIAFDDPHDALVFLANSKAAPIFILSDINMPKLNGFELRAALLKLKPSHKRIPFILLSTAKSAEDISRAKGLEIRGFYRKANSVAGMKQTLDHIRFLLQTCHKNLNGTPIANCHLQKDEGVKYFL